MQRARQVLVSYERAGVIRVWQVMVLYERACGIRVCQELVSYKNARCHMSVSGVGVIQCLHVHTDRPYLADTAITTKLSVLPCPH